MEKSNNTKKALTVLLDTDVIVNWLTKEVETTTGKGLWQIPHKIISLIENKELKGSTSLITLLEIRYLLRRKKEYNEEQIEDFINKITGILDIVVPDEISLLKANKLQSDHHLDPFDAILLSISIDLESSNLISRDSEFLKSAKQLTNAITPEEFLHL